MQTDLLNDDHFDTESLPDFQKKRGEEEAVIPLQPLKPGEVALLTPEDL
jgi:hypothetical protein